jgi:hypothetical protein
MDIISHGLYGGITFGRHSKTSYWKAFFFGVMPDLFSFGIFFAITLLSFASGPDFYVGTTNASDIPVYVHQLYNVTHSLFVASFIICFVWFVQGKFMIEMLAWPLHILVDIPTHSAKFFPTPFLWPVSNFYVDGISWGSPYIFFPNLIILAVLYTWSYYSHKK